MGDLPREHQQENQREYQSDHLARIFGYVCYRIWIGLLFFSSFLFSTAQAASGADSLSSFYQVSIACLALCLLGCGVKHNTILRLWEHRLGEWIGSILCGLGVALLIPAILQGTNPSIAVCIIAGVLTGAGSSLVVLQLGHAFARVVLRDSIVNVLLATLILLPCAAFFAVLPISLARPISAILTLILPALTTLFLSRIDKTKPPAQERNRDEGLRIRPHTLIRFAVCACVLGVITEISRALYTSTIVETFTGDFSLATSILVAVCSLVLLLVGLRNWVWPLSWIYRIAIILMIGGLVMLPALPQSAAYVPSGPAISYVVVNAGYALFESFVWVVLATIANRYQYTSVQVFGYGRALVLLVGQISGAVISPIIVVDTNNYIFVNTIIAISVIGIVVSYALFLTDTEVTMFQMLPSFDEGKGSSAQALIYKVEHESDPSVNKDGSAYKGSGKNAGKSKIPLAKRCAIIGNAYGLTPREIDVFRLLAAGRNSARIQEELAISAGTVNTHCRHIFQKFGVHSQQELIDLFLAADLDEMQRKLTH